LPVSFAYQYNMANQRTRADLGDGSYWIYSYDNLGQVISGRRYWADGTPVLGQQFDYGFDDIGNRTSAGGRESSEATYEANRLNQYDTHTVAGSVDVMGLANVNGAVTVEGNSTTRKGEFFHHSLVVGNSSAAQYPEIDVVSTYGTAQTNTGNVFVPLNMVTNVYDADGNLTYDGRWTYVWNGENRLVQMIRDSASPAGAKQELVFEYDHQGRRIRKTFSTDENDDDNWEVQSDIIYLYDGMANDKLGWE